MFSTPLVISLEKIFWPVLMSQQLSNLLTFNLVSLRCSREQHVESSPNREQRPFSDHLGNTVA